MMQELGDMVNTLAVSGLTIGYVTAGLVMTAGFAVATVDEIKKSRQMRADFDVLKTEYRDDFSPEELEKFYIQISNMAFWPGEKRRELDALCKKAAGQLEPIIDAEIRDTVQGHDGLLPRDERLKDMSPTYRRIRNACPLSANL